MDIKNLVQFINNSSEKVLQVNFDNRLHLFVKTFDEETKSIDMFCGTIYARESSNELNKCFTFVPAKNTIVFGDRLPYEFLTLYGLHKENAITVLRENGFICTTFEDLAKELTENYKNYVVNVLTKKYPSFDSLANLFGDCYDKNWYKALGRKNLLRKTMPKLEMPTPSNFKQDNTMLLLDVLANDNMQKTIEQYASELEGDNIRKLFSHYALLKAMKENELTEEEKDISEKANKITKFIEAHNVKSLTMIYNTADMLRKAYEIVGGKDFEEKTYPTIMQRVIHYLKAHDEIKFKLLKEYGTMIDVSTTHFISTYNTNLKSVFGLGKYDNLPRDIAEMFGNPKYMKDCLYRGKSVL